MSTTRRTRAWFRSPLHRFFVVVSLTVMVGAGVALATPPSGNISRTEVAQGRTTENVSIQASGDTTFSIDLVTVDPGADSGWHTHPGPEFTIVKSGTLIFLKAPQCQPTEFSAGQAVFIPGGTSHLARNEGTVPAELYVTYTRPTGSAVRGDAAEPCPGP